MKELELLRRMGALVLPEFFPPSWCRRTANKMSHASRSPALVHRSGEYALDESARKTKIVRVPGRIANRAEHGIHALQPRIEAHFGVTLGRPERLQWLGYQTGDFFLAHRDSNPAVQSQATIRARRVSMVLFLNDGGIGPHCDYEGGNLVLYGLNDDPAWDKFGASVPGHAGTLVAFLSSTRHEVTAVTRGFRATAVTWFSAGVAESP